MRTFRKIQHGLFYWSILKVKWLVIAKSGKISIFRNHYEMNRHGG